MAPLEPHSMAPRNNSALTKVQLLLKQVSHNSLRSHHMMLQRSPNGSSRNCTVSALTKVELLLTQNYFEEPSNDAQKEPLRLLWGIIRWLHEELYHFCINKSSTFVNAELFRVGIK